MHLFLGRRPIVSLAAGTIAPDIILTRSRTASFCFLARFQETEGRYGVEGCQVTRPTFPQLWSFHIRRPAFLNYYVKVSNLLISRLLNCEMVGRAPSKRPLNKTSFSFLAAFTSFAISFPQSVIATRTTLSQF